jgi:hypothetical protein
MVREHQDAYDSQSAAITTIAEKIPTRRRRCAGEVRQVEIDGNRAGVTTAQAARITELERKSRQLREATRSSARCRRIAAAELDRQRR